MVALSVEEAGKVRRPRVERVDQVPHRWIHVRRRCRVAEASAECLEGPLELYTSRRGEVRGVGGGRRGEEDEDGDQGDDLAGVVGVGEGGSRIPWSLGEKRV